MAHAPRLGFLILLAALVAAPPVLAASGARQASSTASPLDGRWKTTITRAQVLRSGAVNPAVAEELYGPAIAAFGNGRFQVQFERTGRGGRGTFTVTGNRVRFVFATGVGVKPGAAAECKWSVYRDRLTFTAVPARPCLVWNAADWTKVS